MSAMHPRNWFPTLAVLMGVGMLILALVVCNMGFGQEPGCQYQELPLGAVLLSRNIDERQNDSPGFWNHMGLYVGGGYVVEAQTGQYGNGVLRTVLDNYLARPYVRCVLYPRDPAVGARAAMVAATYVGRPYRRYSSLAPRLIPRIVPRILHGTEYGMNCVSVPREAYEAAVGYPLYGFRNPDDALARGDLFHGPYAIQSPQPELVPPNPWTTEGGQ